MNRFVNSITPSAISSLTGFVLFMLFMITTRIPFLFAGYGSEEDSWGMVNSLLRMHHSGTYEASRFPGHPVVEAFYLMVINKGAFIANLFTATLSAAGLYFFLLTLIKLNIKHFLLTTFIVAFTPVVFINSTNNMDYMWALSFMMMSFYFVADKKFFIASILIGIATGCRITSLAILLPFSFLIFEYGLTKRTVSNFVILISATVITALLSYYPLFKSYGLNFITHPATLGYPQLAKTFYKASIGVFGTAGCIVLIYFLFRVILNRAALKIENGFKNHSALLKFAFTAIATYSIIFLFLPQKSAFLIPVIPFIAMICALYLEEKSLLILCTALFVSNFFLGINLNDALRGSGNSLVSYQAKIFSQPVSFDLLKGNLTADYVKRKQKMEFAYRAIEKLKSIEHPTVIIAGFWINEIEVLSHHELNPNIRLTYFINESELKYLSLNSVDIYYLPQQEVVNDLKYANTITKDFAKPLFPDLESDFVY